MANKLNIDRQLVEAAYELSGERTRSAAAITTSQRAAEINLHCYPMSLANESRVADANGDNACT